MQKQTLQQSFNIFISEMTHIAKRAPSTISSYKASFELLIKIYPNLSYDSLSAKLMTDYFKTLNERARVVGGEKKTVKIGITESTVATYRSKLSQFFVWLKSNGLIKVNPFDSIPYPKVNYDDKKYLPKGDIQKILAALTFGPRDQLVRKRNLAMFNTVFFCGIRRNELSNIMVYNIDLEHKVVKINESTSKSKVTRTIPLHNDLIPILKDYWEERQKKGYKTPYFFASGNKDAKLTLAGLKHWVENLNIQSGVDFTLHQIRHTFAVNMLINGCDIVKLSKLMGHKDIRQTMTYLRCLPSESSREDINNLSIEGTFQYIKERISDQDWTQPQPAEKHYTCCLRYRG